MSFIKAFEQFAPGSGFAADGIEYLIDAFQRSILFTDILRKRGNIYLEHLRDGKPPVLTFEYETIMSGKDLDRPVNHDLTRVRPIGGKKAVKGKRPIVVIDPRAGHGPGIGGSKLDSQVGIALREGHPVYFILFHPEPEPGQKLEDVQQAEIRFVEEVGKLHPDEDKPAVIGNCQAGWAVALLSADRPDVTGPLVLSGSPLSYWAGVEGKNRMRYMGGIMGGIWTACFLSDLGNGKFDGANLVANFESLNPANTLWTKQYNVYANVDTEEKRFLNFEKWWNGYFFMTSDEIRFIVENLFIGDKFEQGGLALNKDKTIDLKNLEDPILMFASKGDNITPPQQALNWIAKVYGSVGEIKRNDQVIVYTLHETIGHLGIFVSGSVARKQHKAIIGNIDMLEFLPPGLYEMVFKEKPGDLPVTEFEVVFERREIADILALDDGFEDEIDFSTAAKVSEANSRLYETLVSPLVRSVVTEEVAEAIRQLHPLRVTRYGFSDKNPFLIPFRLAAPTVAENRVKTSNGNIFKAVEKYWSDVTITLLDSYRDTRDDTQEFMFKMIYGNPWMKTLFPDSKPEAAPKQPAKRKRPQKHSEQGGFADGIVRIMLAMADADLIFDPKELAIAEKSVMANDRLKKLAPADFKRMVKEQAAILESDREQALQSLKKLLPTKKDRQEAVEIAKNIADADLVLAEPEKILMKKLREILAI